MRIWTANALFQCRLTFTLKIIWKWLTNSITAFTELHAAAFPWKGGSKPLSGAQTQPWDAVLDSGWGSKWLNLLEPHCPHLQEDEGNSVIHALLLLAYRAKSCAKMGELFKRKKLSKASSLNLQALTFPPWAQTSVAPVSPSIWIFWGLIETKSLSFWDGRSFCRNCSTHIKTSASIYTLHVL